MRAAPALLSLAACAAPARGAPPVDRAPPAGSPGTDIVVAGRRFDVGTPVVLWFEPGGYSAYSTEPSFGEPGAPDAPEGLRYRPGRATDDPALEARIRAGDLEALREVVDLFVVHYDACGTSRLCFQVLHDQRGLSVHFLLDLDGTLYQTLDLADQAWHARQANPRSVGVEIANVGAFPPGSAGEEKLDLWYPDAGGGPRLVLPARLGDGGLRRADSSLRPATPGRVVGRVQGQELVQYDLTPEQYEALARLAAGLSRVFPRIALDAPRDGSGGVRTTVLDDEAFAAWHGVLGHWHVSADKLDPGPAFRWEAFLEAAREHALEAGLAP